MSDLLIRNIDDTLKRELAIQAASHGRSQQAEVISILKETLQPEQNSWIDMLIEGSQSVGGIYLPEAKRHAPRITAVEF